VIWFSPKSDDCSRSADPKWTREKRASQARDLIHPCVRCQIQITGWQASYEHRPLDTCTPCLQVCAIILSRQRQYLCESLINKQLGCIFSVVLNWLLTNSVISDRQCVSNQEEAGTHLQTNCHWE
jgi:hypothetical protein